jgi:hypothetical protein
MEVYPGSLRMADDSRPISPSASDASARTGESSPIALYLRQSQLPRNLALVSAHSQRSVIFEPHSMMPVKPGLDLLATVDIHDRGAVDP